MIKEMRAGSKWTWISSENCGKVNHRILLDEESCRKSKQIYLWSSKTWEDVEYFTWERKKTKLRQISILAKFCEMENS